MNFIGIIVGILILSIMMLVHELGHFLAGKSFGIAIKSFNIFMGPILFSRRGKDGVLYTVRALPIGASVEFYGGESGNAEEEEEDEGESAEVPPPRESLFFQKPRWVRGIVIFMGPLINFLSAFLAFLLLFSFSSVLVPTIATVETNSLAEQAGLKEGDVIVSSNGQRILTALDYSNQQYFADSENSVLVLKDKAGQTRTVNISAPIVERYRLGFTYSKRTDGRIIVSEIDPRSNNGKAVLRKGDELLKVNDKDISDETAFDFSTGKGQNQITVQVLREGKTIELEMQAALFKDKQALGFFLREAKGLEVLQQAIYYPISVVRTTFKGLGLIFSGRLSASEGLTGPIGIVSMVGDVVKDKIAWRDKLTQLLLYFAYISVAIGFTNLLPIPALDGNHLLILAIEGLRRKDLSLKLKERIATIGLIFVFALAALVIILDISRLLR